MLKSIYWRRGKFCNSNEVIDKIGLLGTIGLKCGWFHYEFGNRSTVSLFIMTYNLIWRRRTGYVAFHFSSLPSHCILDRITGDNGRTCKWKCVCQREIFNFYQACKRQNQTVLFLNSWHVSLNKKQLEATIWWFLWGGWLLTIDSKGDLGFPDPDTWDDGFAHVLTGIGLADGLQIQLVAVAQNL